MYHESWFPFSDFITPRKQPAGPPPAYQLWKPISSPRKNRSLVLIVIGVSESLIVSLMSQLLVAINSSHVEDSHQQRLPHMFEHCLLLGKCLTISLKSSLGTKRNSYSGLKIAFRSTLSFFQKSKDFPLKENLLKFRDHSWILEVLYKFIQVPLMIASSSQLPNLMLESPFGFMYTATVW